MSREKPKGSANVPDAWLVLVMGEYGFSGVMARERDSIVMPVMGEMRPVGEARGTLRIRALIPRCSCKNRQQRRRATSKRRTQDGVSPEGRVALMPRAETGTLSPLRYMLKTVLSCAKATGSSL